MLEIERILDDLKTLIGELKKEKENLQRLIDEAVEESEFLSAHFHAEALEQVNARLHTLMSLDDELYDRRHFLEKGIEDLRKLVKGRPDGRVKAMVARLIAEKEKELDELAQGPKKRKDGNGKSYLRECLDQFARGKVRGLRIILSKAENIGIEVRRVRMGTKLSLTSLKRLRANYSFDGERLLKLKGLGFSLNGRGDKATVILTAGKDEIVDKTMRLVSLIVFEVFYFKELDRESTIEVLYRETGRKR